MLNGIFCGEHFLHFVMGYLAGAGVSLQRVFNLATFWEILRHFWVILRHFGRFCDKSDDSCENIRKNKNKIKYDFFFSSRQVAFTITINNSSWHTIRRAATTTIHSSHNTNRAAFIPVIPIPWTTVFREEHFFSADEI